MAAPVLAQQRVESRDQAPASSPGLQALRKAISILDLVTDAERPLRFVELQGRSGLPKGTLHRMLQALLDARLIRLEERDQTYRPGMRLFEMAHRVWRDLDLRGAAEPELERLCALADETVRLALLDGDEVLYIDQRESAHPLRLANGVGGRAPAHASGVGKAMLAHLEPAELHRLVTEGPLERLTPNTITDPDALRHELDLVKARGYAVSIEERDIGISSVASAILDHRARPMGAVGIVGPAVRLAPDQLHALGREVMQAARRISGNAGQSAMTIAVRPRPLGPDRDDLACVVPATAFLGEGPHWSPADQRLYWVDILAPSVHVSDPATGQDRVLPMAELVGAVVTRRRGGLVLAAQNGFRALDPATGAVTRIADPEADRPGNRFNDGKCDRAGRFWAGTLALDATPDQGRLWCLDVDGRVTCKAEGVHVSNGLGWSPDDRRFFFTDSGRRTIWTYDFDLASGEIANRRPFVRFEEGEGMPDGLTVDAEGCLWVAIWDGWCVIRYDPDGKVERVINLPVPRPTSCIFGGDSLTTLFITSARIRLSAQQLAEAPLSGSVFALAAGVRGLAERAYGG